MTLEISNSPAIQQTIFAIARSEEGGRRKTTLVYFKEWVNCFQVAKLKDMLLGWPEINDGWDGINDYYQLLKVSYTLFDYSLFIWKHWQETFGLMQGRVGAPETPLSDDWDHEQGLHRR